MTGQLRIQSLEPTIFFVQDADALQQIVRVALCNEGAAANAHLVWRAAGHEKHLPLGVVPPGEHWHEIAVPDLRTPQSVQFALWADSDFQDQQDLDWQPAKHWEVHVIHYSHHDLGYTGMPLDVLDEHAEFLDEVLHLCQQTQSWPDDAKFRWMCEQAYSFLRFAETRPPEQVAYLAEFIRAGQVEITALFGNMIMEHCGHEELIRQLYPQFRLKQKYGFEILSAEHNDVPGFSWGLASVLAGVGVRYFCPGIPIWYFGLGDQAVHRWWDEEVVQKVELPGGFWWKGPDGARVLLWYDFHGGEWQPTSYPDAVRKLPNMLAQLDTLGYSYDMVSYTLRGGHRDNSPPTLRQAQIVREWNNRWAYPRLISSTRSRFLQGFEASWGGTLKTFSGDLPGTDYPVAATSTPKETALNRRVHDDLLAAEKLATLASVLSDYEYPRHDLNEAYQDSLRYDEHCWGMHDPGGPAMDGGWSQKSGFAYRAAALTYDVTVKAANKLMDRITYPDQGAYLTVFNTLAWERSEIVRAPLHTWSPPGSPLHYVAPAQAGDGPQLISSGTLDRNMIHAPEWLLERPFMLIDMETGASVPYQLMPYDDPQAVRPWAAERHAIGKVYPPRGWEIVFLAEKLPALGMRSYGIVPCNETPQFEQRHLMGDDIVENDFFRLSYEPKTGAITGLTDKALGCQLADSDAPHGLGQIIVRSSETGAELPAQTREVSIAADGPIFTTIRVKGEITGCPRWTRDVTLYHGMRRVDVGARFLRDSTPMLEVYLAFPFAVPHPHFRFEAVDALIEPTCDQLPGSNTDSYAVQHWADVFTEDWGVTWTPIDAPMAEFGGLWPGYVSGAHHGVTPQGYGHPWLKPGEIGKGYIYSLVNYNNFRTNFINVLPGEFLMRYSISPHSGDWRIGRATELGWNAANPPLAFWMTGPQGGSLSEATSFGSVEPANVMLLTLKRAEDGNGFILRLIETEGIDCVARVSLTWLNIVAALETNLVEEDGLPLASTSHTVEIPLTPYSIATVRLVTRLEV